MLILDASSFRHAFNVSPSSGPPLSLSSAAVAEILGVRLAGLRPGRGSATATRAGRMVRLPTPYPGCRIATHVVATSGAYERIRASWIIGSKGSPSLPNCWRPIFAATVSSDSATDLKPPTSSPWSRARAMLSSTGRSSVRRFAMAISLTAIRSRSTRRR